LLKDRNGVIDLQLPVDGSLDDPSFHIAPVVWKLLEGLVRKIVTAPFALLGSLFGGGEELAYVDFPAGIAELPPAQAAKLSELARALIERPQLKLDIPLHTQNADDDLALEQAALEQALGAVQLAPPARPAMPPGRTGSSSSCCRSSRPLRSSGWNSGAHGPRRCSPASSVPRAS